MSTAPIDTTRLDQTNLAALRASGPASGEATAIPAVGPVAVRRSDNPSEVGEPTALAPPARPSRRGFIMNSIVSAASVASAAAVAAPTIADAAAPAMKAVSFPDLIPRFVRLRERWHAQLERDQAETDHINKLFFEASGITNKQRLELDCNSPEGVQANDIRHAIADSVYALDDDGWTEISEEADVVCAAILRQTPHSIIDLAWQAEAAATMETEMFESQEDFGELVIQVLKNVRALAGPLPIPDIGLCWGDFSDQAHQQPRHTDKRAADPIFAAIADHRSAVEAHDNAVHEKSRLEGVLPRDRCRSLITLYERKIVETDDARWIEAEELVDKANNIMDAAAMVIVNLEPETVQGAIAVLQYAVDHMDRYDGLMMGWPKSLFPDRVDEEDTGWQTARSSEYFLMQNVAASLARLA